MPSRKYCSKEEYLKANNQQTSENHKRNKEKYNEYQRNYKRAIRNQIKENMQIEKIQQLQQENQSLRHMIAHLNCVY